MAKTTKQLNPMPGEAMAVYRAWKEAQHLLCRCASGCDCGNEEARAQSRAFYEVFREEAFRWLDRNLDALVEVIPVSPPPDGFSDWNIPVTNGTVRVNGNRDGFRASFKEKK